MDWDAKQRAAVAHAQHMGLDAYPSENTLHRGSVFAVDYTIQTPEDWARFRSLQFDGMPGFVLNVHGLSANAVDRLRDTTVPFRPAVITIEYAPAEHSTTEDDGQSGWVASSLPKAPVATPRAEFQRNYGYRGPASLRTSLPKEAEDALERANQAQVAAFVEDTPAPGASFAITYMPDTGAQASWLTSTLKKSRLRHEVHHPYPKLVQVNNVPGTLPMAALTKGVTVNYYSNTGSAGVGEQVPNDHNDPLSALLHYADSLNLRAGSNDDLDIPRPTGGFYPFGISVALHQGEDALFQQVLSRANMMGYTGTTPTRYSTPEATLTTTWFTPSPSVGAARSADQAQQQLVHAAAKLGIQARPYAPQHGGAFGLYMVLQPDQLHAWEEIHDFGYHLGYDADIHDNTSHRTLTALHDGTGGGQMNIEFAPLSEVGGVPEEAPPAEHAAHELAQYIKAHGLSVARPSEVEGEAGYYVAITGDPEPFAAEAEAVGDHYGVDAFLYPQPYQGPSGQYVRIFAFHPKPQSNGIGPRLQAIDNRYDQYTDFLNPYPDRSSTSGAGQDGQIQAMRNQQRALYMAAENNLAGIPLMLGMTEMKAPTASVAQRTQGRTQVGCHPSIASEMDGYNTYATSGQFGYSPPTRWRLR